MITGFVHANPLKKENQKRTRNESEYIYIRKRNIMPINISKTLAILHYIYIIRGFIDKFIRFHNFLINMYEKKETRQLHISE